MNEFNPLADQGNIFYNHVAEAVVICAFSKYKESQKHINEFIVEDFHKPEHQQLFKTIQTMALMKKHIDLVTLSESLIEQYGNDTVLVDLLPMWGSEINFNAKANIKPYIDIVKKAAFRRELNSIIEYSAAALHDSENDANVVMDQLRQLLREMKLTGHSWNTHINIMLASYEALERRQKGSEPIMPTGITSLDRHISGLHKGELTVIGARPAVGKSALGMQIAIASSESGYKVGVCSREMTAEQYGIRILARGTYINSAALRTGDISEREWQQLSDSFAIYSDLNISYLFSIRYIEDLRAEVQNRVDSEGLDLLIVDYLQLMQSNRRFEKDYIRIGYVSKMLKDMAVDFNIAVVALAQVGRTAQNNMPTLGELRGSGDIEQDADNVIFMHTPKDADDLYLHPDDKQMFMKLESMELRYLALNIAKHRQGETARTAVLFDPAHMNFIEIQR